VAFFARTTGMETVVLRFSHTQDASELLDPDSFFSGPRFYLRARIRQQAAFGNSAVVEALKPHDDGTEKLLISRGQDGTVFRMPITDTRDIVDGLIAALDRQLIETSGNGRRHVDELAFDIPLIAGRRLVRASAEDQWQRQRDQGRDRGRGAPCTGTSSGIVIAQVDTTVS